jgi:F-type H+-transporting ATPase subunit b
MIEISWPLLAIQIFTFLIAMVIVWKLFWGPLKTMMQDRSRKITDDLQRAESGRREIESLEGEYHRRLAEIEEKARTEINEALQRGNLAKDEIVKEARGEAQRILDKARQDLTAEREQLIREMRRQVTDISMSAVERLIGASMDRKVQERLLDQFLGDLEKAGQAK